LEKYLMKTWFITGASRGFGALITERALVKGDAVVATARNPQAVVDRSGAHPNLLAVALDVSNEEQAAAAAKAAIKRFGRIDVLLNNAGFGLMGAVEEASAAEIEAVYRTNVRAVDCHPRSFALHAQSANGAHPQHLVDWRIPRRRRVRHLFLDQVRG
jgi:NAD(P)-dependent dehydrogenase (short-subunit alcohol dehydrogenase family)